MGRLFLLLLIALGAGLYFPSTRARILEKAEPLIGPVLLPIKTTSTREELRQVATDLQGQERLYGRLPADTDSFRKWLFDQYATEENTQDSWGRVYGYQLWPDSFAVRSSGPDLEDRTDDDLTVTRPRISRRDRRSR